MAEDGKRNAPGQVRDAILQVLRTAPEGLTAKRIYQRVTKVNGPTPESSIRSYLRLNTPDLFAKEARGVYRIKASTLGAIRQDQFLSSESGQKPPFRFRKATLIHDDCLGWLDKQEENSIHAVVTDPPYGLHEYTPKEQRKLRNGRGGVWRIPPSFDGHRRSPLPRFTTLTDSQRKQLREFFFVWASLLLPKLTPGANVIVASNPLLSHIVSDALASAGLERRGDIIRLVMTMRGGDRPKAAEIEFRNVTVMPRSMAEPWVMFRRPLDGRVQDNLRKWKTGGFRRPSDNYPFGDVIRSSPTRRSEKQIAPHPSLKPQEFMRKLVRGVLPLGEGVVLDPFAGAGSTLAAAEAVGYSSIGIEKDPHYFDMATRSIQPLSELVISKRQLAGAW